MSLASIILLIYFIGGLLALLVFDLITHRIRNRFRDKAAEAQLVMAQTGNFYIGKRVMLAMFAIITYLFWPFVVLGALRGSEKEEQPQKIVTRAEMMGAGLRKQLAYWAKRIWYGECPECGVILTPKDMWGQYSACPVCKTEFHGIRMKAKKEEKHGET